MNAVRTAACVLACLAAISLKATTQPPSSGTPLVLVVPITGTIDLGLAPFLARAIDEAERNAAAAVLLDINTFGGRVDAAVAMRDALLQAPVRTIAFVHPRAISAGALIALATDTIVITPGGTIGAAMPVTGGTGGAPQATDEKTVSYLRSEFRATAEHRGRPGRFAEAMVDVDVAIDEVVEAGKLLTLSGPEALTHGVAELTAETPSSALAAAGLAGAELRYLEQTWAESVVRGITHPVVSSLLMTVGLLGLLVEIRTPGFALPGLIGLLSLGLVFWGHWIVQLAGWEHLALTIGGLVLLGIEVFVLPGFGVAGLIGIVALLAGLALMLIGAGATFGVVVGALGRVVASLLLALVGGAVLLTMLPRLPWGRRLVLETGMPAEEGYASAPTGDRLRLGLAGIAESALRPAGVADIHGARVDVVSDGPFIEAGTPIEVTRVDGNRIVVRARRAGKD